jgi:hypothetical protein
MTKEQKTRIKKEINETVKLLERFSSLKCFDKYQEADKQKNVDFYSNHLIKLANMVA